MMKIAKWVLKNFFLAILAVLVLVYWQWFRLTPDFGGEFIFGITPLAFYGLFTVLEKIPRLRPSIFLLIVFCSLLIGYIASITTSDGRPSGFDLIGILVLCFYAFFTALAKSSEDETNERRVVIRRLISFIAILFLFITPPIYCSLFQPGYRQPSIDYLGIMILGFYCFFIILTRKLTYEQHVSKFLAASIAGIFLFINGLNILSMPELVTSIDCNGKTYQITYHPNIIEPGYSKYRMTIWKGMFDYSSSFLGYSWGFGDSQFTCDKDNNLVRHFIGDILFHTYESQNQEYEYEAGDTFNDIEYSLYSYEENDVKKYITTTCKPDLPETCQFLPLEYSSPASSTEWASFIVDRKTGDIHILFDGDRGAVYTDLHNHSQKVKLITSFTPYIAPDQAYAGKGYGLLSYQTDGSFAYIFYRCDDLISDYPSDCDYIPFSYTTPDEQDADLNFDKTTDQLILSISGKVVFTYNHPFDF